MPAPEDRPPVHRLLEELETRDPEVEKRLFELIYEEFRGIASRMFAAERPRHTLQPTALVHETYMRMVDQRDVDWRGRTHFMAIGAAAMRRVLLDHARGRDRQKRGEGRRGVTLTDPDALNGPSEFDALDLHEALEELEALDPRQARLVELRFFSGLTVPEVGELLGISTRHAEREWTLAKAWLRRRLDRGTR